MSMTAGLDCGPVFIASEIEIAGDETAGSLHDKLAKLGGDLLAHHLDDILENRIEAGPQDETAATYAAKIQKTVAQLDWSKSASELERQVRAYNPVPGAFFFAPADGVQADDSLRIKCWRAQSVEDVNAMPGTVVASDADGTVVACGRGALRLVELQLPGKRRVAAREFSDQLDLVGRVLG